MGEDFKHSRLWNTNLTQIQIFIPSLNLIIIFGHFAVFIIFIIYFLGYFCHDQGFRWYFDHLKVRG